MQYLTQNTSTEFDQAFSTLEQEMDTTYGTNTPELGGFFAIAAVFWIVIIAITIFELIFKAKALWRAARMSDKTWFILLLIFNTAGILPLIYISMTKDKYRETILKKFKD